MKIPSLGSITSTQLRRAAKFMDRIQSLQKKVAAILTPAPVPVNGHAIPRKMSLAARRKISRAQKAAWATRRKSK